MIDACYIEQLAKFTGILATQLTTETRKDGAHEGLTYYQYNLLCLILNRNTVVLIYALKNF